MVGYRPDVSDKKLINLKVGISGIEKLYNKKALGSHGWRKIETTIWKNNENPKTRIFKARKNIQTNLISEVQEYAFNSLRGV